MESILLTKIYKSLVKSTRIFSTPKKKIDLAYENIQIFSKIPADFLDIDNKSDLGDG
jgi:hypothetical protein